MSARGGMGREQAPGCDLLHNMSAPPRLKITLNPIPAPPRTSNGDVASRDVLPLGLRVVARVNLDPFRAIVDREYRGSYEYTAWELARLVLITRLAQGQPHQSMTTLRRRSHEFLQDELRKGLAAIDVPRPDLPEFAIVCRGEPDDACEVPCETDSARALSLVARVTGSVYVGRRDPRVASLLQKEVVEYRFYAAAGPIPGKETT